MGHGVAEKPLPNRQAVQVHRQVRVDVDEITNVDDVRDPVAEIGDRERPIKRPRRLSGKCRREWAKPARRRAQFTKGAAVDRSNVERVHVEATRLERIAVFMRNRVLGGRHIDRAGMLQLGFVEAIVGSPDPHAAGVDDLGTGVVAHHGVE